MKKNFNRTFLSIALAATCAGSAFAHGSSGSVSGSDYVQSNSASAVSVTGAGSATSQAANVGFAATQVFSSGSAGSTGYGQTNAGTISTPTSVNTSGKYGEVRQSGLSETYNSSYVKTTSSGIGAYSTGAATGVAASNTSGDGSFHTISGGPTGNVSGGSAAKTVTSVSAFQNGIAEQTSGMLSNWGAVAAADITYQKVKSDGVWGKGDIKNASTSTYANAISTIPQVSTQSGSATGYTTNLGTAFGNAASSVKGMVSVSH